MRVDSEGLSVTGGAPERPQVSDRQREPVEFPAKVNTVVVLILFQLNNLYSAVISIMYHSVKSTAIVKFDFDILTRTPYETKTRGSQVKGC
jgi:hypothetical protein